MNNIDCIFCKIIDGDIPCKKIFESESVLAFHDINPKAPVHALIIPKIHVQDINSLKPEHSPFIEAIFNSIPEIAKILDVHESGYRIVINNGKNSGQEVFHLHFHLLGGVKLGMGLGK
jgi:histidine triad (HIT) family protein